MLFWRSSLDITFRRGKFNSFTCVNNFASVIIFFFFFCNPQLGYKNLFFYTPVHVSFYTLKYCSLSEQLNLLHCWLSVSVYLHCLSYTWEWKFLLCLYTESIFNSSVALQYMKMCLNVFFPHFHITMHKFTFYFYRLCFPLFK